MRSHLLSGILIAATLSMPAPAFAGTVAEPYVANRNPATFDRSLQCLTEAIYYEARSESEDGQRAVAQVVLNRVRHPAYPNTVCGVVYQGAERTTGCQFSFTCTGVMGPIGEPAAWDRARRIAMAALRGNVFRPVGLAVNYHTTAIRPYWAPSLITQTTVGAHVFYTRPDSRSVEAFSQLPGNYEPETFGRMRGERYEDVRVEQPIYAPRMRERFAQERRVPGRDRYQPLQIAEIPIPARELVYRTYGPRPTQRATQASSQNAARPTARQQRQAPARSGPRVVRQSNGIRIVYGN
ncbi:MAG TPA: cell wall hydrolase [Allosphingosinicella sp.]|nr:cell wall hydrolase [Allosphingosinicella sp.]